MIIIYGDKTKTKIGNKSSQTHAEIRVGYKRFCRSLRHELTVNGVIFAEQIAYNCVCIPHSNGS